MNHARTPAYLAAHAEAERMLKAGEIRAYSASHCYCHGRQIHLETDQGWNPEPFYCEAEAEPRPAGADDSLPD